MEENTLFLPMKKNEIIILIVIVACALIVRLYANITAPLLDYHSSQQASAMTVAENYTEKGIDLLFPQHNDRYNYQRNTENPQSLYMYEFPLYSAFVASIAHILPSTPIEYVGRGVSIFSSLIVIALIYYLTLQLYGLKQAVTASSIFALFPFFIFFSRTALSDMFASAIYMTGLAMIYLFYKSETRKQVLWYTLSLVFFSLSVLVRPGFLLFIVPFLYFFFQKYRWNMGKKLHVLAFCIISLIPLVFWTQHVYTYTEGITFSYFVPNTLESISLSAIIIPTEKFFEDVLNTHVLTYILGGLLVIFMFTSMSFRTNSSFLFWALGSCLTYLLFFQTKHAEYEFYQVIMLPFIAMSIGVGLLNSFNKQTSQSRVILIVLASSIILYSFYISFRQARYFFAVSDEQIQIAKVIQTLTEPNNQIITDTDGNTTLLYIANRSGATTPYDTPQNLKTKGYSYIVTQKENTRIQYKEDFQLNPVFENDSFSLFRL